MSLEQTLTEMNEQIKAAKESGDNDTFKAVGDKANQLLMDQLASFGYTRNQVAQAVFSVDVYKEREEKLAAIFMGQYAGTRAEFPLLVECSKKIYEFVVEGVKLALAMNSQLGFNFFGHFENGGERWEEELNGARNGIQVILDRTAERTKQQLDQLECMRLNEMAAEDGYKGKTPASLIAMSSLQSKQVLDFVQLMATLATGCRNKGMAADAREIIQQWMLREQDATSLKKTGAPYMQLVSVPQAIGLGLLSAVLSQVIDGKTPSTTIEA